MARDNIFFPSNHIFPLTCGSVRKRFPQLFQRFLRNFSSDFLNLGFRHFHIKILRSSPQTLLLAARFSRAASSRRCRSSSRKNTSSFCGSPDKSVILCLSAFIYVVAVRSFNPYIYSLYRFLRRDACIPAPLFCPE